MSLQPKGDIEEGIVTPTWKNDPIIDADALSSDWVAWSSSQLGCKFKL